MSFGEIMVLGSEVRTDTKTLMIDDTVDTYPQQKRSNQMHRSSMAVRDQLASKKQSLSPINFIGAKIDRR